MKYVVNVRMNNVGPAKFLMATKETNEQNHAFYIANSLLEEHADCFAEIVDSRTNEIIATIN